MEMKAALKVLNDSIHRPQRGSSKLLVNAIEIVRREWIQVTFTLKYRLLCRCFIGGSRSLSVGYAYGVRGKISRRIFLHLKKKSCVFSASGESLKL